MLARRDPDAKSGWTPPVGCLRYFTRFMGLDTAFFVGPEAIARAARLPVFYLAMRRESRGFTPKRQCAPPATKVNFAVMRRPSRETNPLVRPSSSITSLATKCGMNVVPRATAFLSKA